MSDCKIIYNLVNFGELSRELNLMLLDYFYLKVDIDETDLHSISEKIFNK